MKKHHWYVWDENQKVLCEGSRVVCLRYYKRYGGCKAGLRLGYYF